MAAAFRAAISSTVTTFRSKGNFPVVLSSVKPMDMSMVLPTVFAVLNENSKSLNSPGFKVEKE